MYELVVIFFMMLYPIFLYRYVLYYSLKGLYIYLRSNIRKKINSQKPITMNRHQGYLQITYKDHNDTKSIYVPVRHDIALESSQCEVIAHISKDLAIPLVQENDVPIFVTAEDLGAKYISVRNIYTQEERLFKGNENVEFFM